MSFKLPCAAVIAACLITLNAPAWAQTTDDPVVARINGAELRRSDIVEAQKGLPKQYKTMPLARIFEPLLRELINVRLIAAAARAEGLDKDKGVQLRLDTARDRILGEAFMEREMVKRITDKKLRKRYEEFVKKAPANEEVRARHILVKTEAEAVEVIKQLDGGADFAKLAREKSTGPSGARGGDLGFFGPGQMVGAFSAAAFALEVGKFTPRPVQTQFGWHVIKVEEKRKKPPPTFKQARDRIYQEIRGQIMKDIEQDLRKSAKIEEYKIDGSPKAPPRGIQMVPK